MQSYNIINTTQNKEYNLDINNIIELIRTYPNDNFIKFIDGKQVQICNQLALNTLFICHRINTIDELSHIPNMFGLEIDIRDDPNTNELHLSHDPFNLGVSLDEYLQYNNSNNHNTIILNIKSERTELKCIELMQKYNIENYFFLDTNMPMTYLLNNKYNNTKIACRFSEFEPIENYIKIKNMITWIWVDCFTIQPLTNDIYHIMKCDRKRVCIVSPELQGSIEKIEPYRQQFINNNIIPDAICCKLYNIIKWI